MIINHNMASLNTYRQFNANNAQTAKSLEKLSSGLRINRAGDDAAGLAISEKMRGQIRGLDQASRNAQDSISLIQTAEGALNETHSILQRMRELSVQSSNDTATDSDRAEIQKEIDQLTDEIDRIGNTTEFNTKKLLNGGVGVRMSSNGTELSGVGTTSATKTGVYAVAVTAVATQAVVASSADAAATVGGSGGSITINGTAVTLASTDDMGDVVQKINNYSSSTGVKAVIEKGSDATHQRLKLVSSEYGSAAAVSVEFSSAAVSTALGFGGTISLSDSGTDVAGTVDGSATGVVGKGTVLTVDNAGANADGLSVENNISETAAAMTIRIGNGNDSALGATTAFSINGYQLTTDLSITLAHGTYNTDADKATQLTSLINAASDITGVTAVANGDYIELTSNAKGVESEITLSGTGASATAGDGVISAASLTAVGDDGVSASDANNITVAKDSVLKTHIGANEDQTMDIDINDMRASALGVNNLNVTSQSGAEDAITTINDAIEQVSAERSKLGAFQNRLEHTIANLGTSSENLTAAESRIRDVDMAKEMMNFQKNNILSQAAQAMLAQANQQPQGVLQLLR